MVATLFVSSASAGDQYLRMATYAVGDRPIDVASYSDAFLTEYRFQSGAHSYALSRSLRDAVARDLVFIDDRLACVLKKRRYSAWYHGDDPSLFWSDRQIWQDPVAKWEWASESGGLEYLAALLRDACGLEPVRERRELQRDWGSRTKTAHETADELADTASDFGKWFVVWGPLCVLAQGYCPNYESKYQWDEFERRDRRDIEQRIWSLILGLPQEKLPAEFGVPDVQYTWPKTATTVNAYYLGSPNRFFVGLIDGRVVWVHADYPGLIMQAKLAAQQQADTGK